MSRIIAIGLTTLVLSACQPVAEPAAPVEPAVSAAPVAPAPTQDAAWTVLEDRYHDAATAPADPIGALEWRGVLCDHLSGEFGGDNSERDRQVNARMEELRCGDELAAEARALRATRAGDPDAVGRLDVLLTRLDC